MQWKTGTKLEKNLPVRVVNSRRSQLNTVWSSPGHTLSHSHAASSLSELACCLLLPKAACSAAPSLPLPQWMMSLCLLALPCPAALTVLAKTHLPEPLCSQRHITHSAHHLFFPVQRTISYNPLCQCTLSERLERQDLNKISLQNNVSV